MQMLTGCPSLSPPRAVDSAGLPPGSPSHLSVPPPAFLDHGAMHILQLPSCPFVSIVSINIFEVLKDGPVLVTAGFLPG